MLSEQTIKQIANNGNFTDKKLLSDLTELFQDKSEACEYLHLYGQYIELVDDLVDEEPQVDRVQEATKYAALIGNCSYWNKWKGYLYLVERLIHNTYFDSVIWEKSNTDWKRKDAKCLSHVGYNMLFAVILIEFGEDKLREYSIRFREHAHLKHLND